MSGTLVEFTANDGTTHIERVSEALADLLFSRDLARPGAIRTEMTPSKEN